MAISRMSIASVFAVACILNGCAGNLLVYDGEQKLVSGVPFRTTEAYVKIGKHTKHSKGGDCQEANFVENATIATGPLYFASVKTAQFAKTGFHIKYAENGSVSEIGLDTEPAAAESLKATGELLKTILPFAGGVAATAAPAMVAEAPSKACDSGEDSVRFVRLDEYIKAQGK